MRRKRRATKKRTTSTRTIRVQVVKHAPKRRKSRRMSVKKTSWGLFDW